MKIKTLLCGIGIMALSSCASEKLKSWMWIKPWRIVTCKYIVRWLNWKRTGRRIIVCSLEISCRVKSSGIAGRWLRKNGQVDSGQVFCGTIMKLHNDTIRELAEKYTESLKLFSEIPAYDHDLGFLVFCSYGNGYRLTHNPTYRDVIIATADSLATLYNAKVGTILSWPRNIEMLGGHNTIMDNVINLEMLFWAARNGGDRRLFDVAVSHADKTMKNQFRPDYTSYHVAVI